MAGKKKTGCLSGCMNIVIVGFLIVLAIGIWGPERQNRIAVDAPVHEQPAAEKPAPAPAPVQVNSKRIPGLMPVDVYGNYTKLGFAKTGPTEMKGDATFDAPEYRYFWKCEEKSNTGQTLNIVEIYGGSTSSVTVVSGSSFGLSEKDRSDFLSHVATVPYDGSEQQAARDWVRSNISANKAIKSFGGVRFELSQGRVLRIGNSQ